MAAILVATSAFFATPTGAHAPAADKTNIEQTTLKKAGALSFDKPVETRAISKTEVEPAPVRILQPIAVPVPRPKPVVSFPVPKAKPTIVTRADRQREFKVSSAGVAKVTSARTTEVKQRPSTQAQTAKRTPSPGVRADEPKQAHDKHMIERVTLVFDGMTWHLLKKDDSIKGHNKDTTRLVTCGGGKYNKGLKNGQYNCRPDGVGVKVDVGDIVGIDGAYVGVYGFQNSFGKPVRAVLVGKNWDVLDGKVTLGLSIGYDFSGGYKSRIVGAPEAAFNLDKITGRQELAGWSIVTKVSPLGITRDGHSSLAGLIGVQYKFSNNWLKPQL